ncbi:MAG TPA: sigma-70 family RNA polymerase sigma factor [Phycisphaerae bacterium]|nr:sigma-70 family RNA polymerase sigma factor [Phycisphaerales bacterium]HRX85397.1 sigma-70 family RNA polymerase sigma factor [Phycisphaerae bacterium]
MVSTKINRELFSRAPMLRAYINRRLPLEMKRTIAPDDILQEVWIRAHRFLRDGGGEAIDSFDRWLLTLTSSVLVDQLRAHQAVKRGGRQRPARMAAEQTTFLDLFNRVASSRTSPSTEVAVGEAVRLLQSALECIPEDLGRVVRMRHIQGMSYEQISREIDRSIPAVRGLLTRGMRKLRTELRSASRFFSDAGTTLATRDQHPPMP